MIDFDVGQIVEGELLDGEEILWAEKTSQHALDHHESLYKLSSKKVRYCKIFLLISFVALPLIEVYSKGMNNWGPRTSLQAFGASILYLVFLSGMLLTAFSLYKNYKLKGRVYRMGAYALTNKRLFEFDYDLTLLRHLDASRVAHVYGMYGMEGVTLKPIGSKWGRSYQLGLMENTVLTINCLQGQITKARG